MRGLGCDDRGDLERIGFYACTRDLRRADAAVGSMECCACSRSKASRARSGISSSLRTSPGRSRNSCTASVEPQQKYAVLLVRHSTSSVSRGPSTASWRRSSSQRACGSPATATFERPAGRPLGDIAEWRLPGSCSALACWPMDTSTCLRADRLPGASGVTLEDPRSSCFTGRRCRACSSPIQPWVRRQVAGVHVRSAGIRPVDSGGRPIGVGGGQIVARLADRSPTRPVSRGRVLGRRALCSGLRGSSAGPGLSHRGRVRPRSNRRVAGRLSGTFERRARTGLGDPA